MAKQVDERVQHEQHVDARSWLSGCGRVRVCDKNYHCEQKRREQRVFMFYFTSVPRCHAFDRHSDEAYRIFNIYLC